MIIYCNTASAMEGLKEAADTLKRLPGAMMKNKLTSWPEIVQNSAAQMHVSGRFIKTSPNPTAISNMDKTLNLLLKLSQKERRLVWCRAVGISWRKLENIEGLSHVTLRKHVEQGLQKMLG